MDRKVGEVDFGPDAAFDENAITLDWYDYLFKGKQNEFANGKPVKIFVMGENKWRDEASWPLERAKETRYSLHSDGKANSAAGDGVLSTAAAAARKRPTAYVYDPANPVPTVGGPLCCDALHLAPGPRDQKPGGERGRMCWSTPRRRSIRTRRSPGRSRSISLRSLRPWIRTLPASWWMWGRMALRST